MAGGGGWKLLEAGTGWNEPFDQRYKNLLDPKDTKN